MQFFSYKTILKKYINTFLNYLAYYLITQNIITIAMLPLYSSWGLPFSILSIFGNFIFAPFLSLFLFLSTILFIGFIFQIPFFSIIFLLKKIVKIWIFLMTFFGTNNLSIFFVNNENISYPLCWASAFLLIYSKTFRKSIFLWFILSTIICCTCIFTLSKIKPKKNIILIEDKENTLIIYKIKNNIFIFKRPFLTRKSIIKESLISYHLMPELAKEFGTNNNINFVE
jgi:hypothetical protein